MTLNAVSNYEIMVPCLRVLRPTIRRPSGPWVRRTRGVGGFAVPQKEGGRHAIQLEGRTGAGPCFVLALLSGPGKRSEEHPRRELRRHVVSLLP